MVSFQQRMGFPTVKAVILAGGEGTRLRPLSLGLPKPMTPLFDKPVMEHIIHLLRRSGVTDIAVTLHYMPGAILDYFGDGSAFGVSLTYFMEQEPLGTAGGVKNCMSFLGDEDFLVVSGDAVCDLDLTAAAAFHKTRRSAATLVLYRHPAPLAYGLVMTDGEGRVERFVEKPAWGQVLTNMVNTGIYFLTRRAMDAVPEGTACDFGRDLFPALLARGEALYGVAPEGYWCDMGDCAAYLECAADALSGRVRLEIPAPLVAPGVWSASPIPAGVQVAPPCYIGRGVELGEGALVGPHTALGSGSTVGRRALIQRSVLHAASAGDRASLCGAILCRGAAAGRGAVLREGTVLGENSSAGENCILTEGVKVWPGRTAPAGGRLTASLAQGGLREPLKFADGGVLRGAVGEEMTPETLVLLGNILGAEGQAGLAHAGGEGARMLAQAAASGMSAAGCRVLSHDGGSPSACAWMGGYYGLPASLFVQQEGDRIYLHLFDRRGLPLDRDRQRKLEGALLRGEQTRVPAGRVGRWESLSGIQGAYAADAARRSRLSKAPLRPLQVAVAGRTPADLAMLSALEQLGCAVCRTARPGVPSFQTGHGGFRLRAWDEEGEPVTEEALLAVAALIECQRGGGPIAVPSAAPAALDTLAAGCGTAVLRLGRDGPEAGERYEALPWLRDAVFAACRICARMGVTGERLRGLTGKIPRFQTAGQEVPLRGDRGAVMQALAGASPAARPAGEGLRLRSGEGWVYVTPLARRSALKVIAEGPDMEIAQELCDFYAAKVKKLDQGT